MNESPRLFVSLPKNWQSRGPCAASYRVTTTNDVFWVVFSLVSASGEALFLSSAREAELVVRIRDKEGRVHWPIPESIRKRSRAIAARSKD